MNSTLPAVPLYDAGRGGAAGLARLAPGRLARVMALCRAQYGGLALSLGDAFARGWLRRNSSPLAQGSWPCPAQPARRASAPARRR